VIETIIIMIIIIIIIIIVVVGFTNARACSEVFEPAMNALADERDAASNLTDAATDRYGRAVRIRGSVVASFFSWVVSLNEPTHCQKGRRRTTRRRRRIDPAPSNASQSTLEYLKKNHQRKMLIAMTTNDERTTGTCLRRWCRPSTPRLAAAPTSRSSTTNSVSCRREREREEPSLDQYRTPIRNRLISPKQYAQIERLPQESTARASRCRSCARLLLTSSNDSRCSYVCVRHRRRSSLLLVVVFKPIATLMFARR
jgi:hypothetical protein